MPDDRRPLTASFERFCACLNQFDVEYGAAGRPTDLADVTAVESAREG